MSAEFSVCEYNPMRYHGTDEDSGHDIADNGLNKKKWKKIVDGEGGDPTGFSLTDDLDVARQHAQKAATLRNKPGAIIAADDSRLPAQATGDGTKNFDPGETKIRPKDMRKVGPGVFKIVEDRIPPLTRPSPSPPMP
jgi:hypothetical protein